MARFKVGQKVVCVDDSFDIDKIRGNYKQLPVKDKVYTIRGTYDNDGIVNGVLLEEVVNLPIWIELVKSLQEPAFAEWRFEPLITTEEQEEFEDEIDALLEEVLSPEILEV